MMTRGNKIFLAKIAVIVAVPVVLYAYAEGPLPWFTGVPGEVGTCTYCHTSGGVGSGSVKVKFPNGLTYTAGITQQLTVTVSDPVQQRWGFQLTARQANDSTAQAGIFTPGSDGYTQIVCGDKAFQTYLFPTSQCDSTVPLEYIEHTTNGTRTGQQGTADFTFDWTPPATAAGNIIVYVVGNAADGDGTPGGDYIYATTYTLTPASAANKPAIAKTAGVVNGASFQAGICAGSWVTIEGTKLANSSRTWRTSEIVNGKLPTQLDGVSVQINGKTAYIEYISPTQINVQAPSDTAAGPVNVQVTNNGVTSDPVTAQLQAASPAFFLWKGKYAVATRADYSWVGPPNLFPNATTVPAKPGDIIILWGTGFGATNPAVPAGMVPSAAVPGKVGNVIKPPTVLVGGITAKVLSAVLSPQNAGLYQIAITLPVNVGSGDQSVVVESAGFHSPSGVFINVAQ
jgi:uncharacterized protein (TIGR03437 family)